MLRWIFEKRIAAFERQNDYDMSYARDMLAADPRALLAFSKVQAMSGYRKDVPPDVWAATAVAGTMAADCGPCTQLMVTLALRQGVASETLAAVVRRDDAALREEVRLGVQFARATLAHDLQADALRAQIVRRWGPRALISLAFAITVSQVYPTLKYALGHSKTCSRVVVAGTPVSVLQVEGAA